MDPWNLWCRSLPIESKFQQNEISCPSIQPARCFMKSCSSIFVWSMLTKLSKINPMSSYRFFKMKTKHIFGSVMAAQARGNVNRHFYILRDLRIHEVESVYCVHRQSWTGPKSSQLAGAPAACRPHGTTHFPRATWEKAFFSGHRMADPALEAALEIKLKGNALFKETNFEEAIKLYSQAIDACPKHRYEWLAMWFNSIQTCQLSVSCNLTKILT